MHLKNFTWSDKDIVIRRLLAQVSAKESDVRNEIWQVVSFDPRCERGWLC